MLNFKACINQRDNIELLSITGYSEYGSSSGGGGASDIRRGETKLVVAGGGGGVGCAPDCYGCAGGHGGGLVGGDGREQSSGMDIS